MRTTSVDRPKDWEVCEVHTFADLHMGDPLADEKLLADRIRRCEETENCVVILDGDLCNNATTASVSDTYAENLSPMQALTKVTNLFGKLAEQGKIIALTDGNHERRSYKADGIDMSAIIAQQLRVPYSPGAMLIFLRFGETRSHGNHHRPQLYTIFVNHGSGGGSKVGGKANRLVEMASVTDADLFIHAHTHEPLVVKRSFFRTSPANNSVSQVERLFVNVGSILDYGGYSEIGEFAPTSKSTPVVYLSGTERKMYASL